MENCFTDELQNRIENLLHDYLRTKLDNQLIIENEVRYFEVDTRMHVSTARFVPDRQCMVTIELGEFRMLPFNKGEQMLKARRCDYVTVTRGDAYTAIVFLYPAAPLMRP